MPPTGTVLLSWNAARLVALILNALYGLQEYYSVHYKELDLDGLFGLRVIQGQMRTLYIDFDRRGLDAEILKEIHNLSIHANVIANRALPFVSERDTAYFNQFRFLVTHPYEIARSAQRTDERLRWMDKERPREILSDGEGLWFSESCFAEVLSKEYDTVGDASKCAISENCLQRMFASKGLSGYRLTHQILFAAIVQLVPCAEVASRFLLAEHNQTLDGFAKEFCTNMIEELLSFQKNARTLARLNYYQKDLLMEQVFACGQFGFVETSSLHLLVSVLSWQHPTLGCFTKEKPEDLTHSHLQKPVGHSALQKILSPRKILNDVVHDDECSSHSATVAAGALSVFLRFTLDPGPWPEFALAGQPVTVQNILAEDRFRQFNYARWVRDTFPSQFRLSRPPQLGWSPDLLAYVLLLSFLFFGFLCGQFCCKRKSKRMYHFAYKKL